ncbi:Isochorismatase-like protein [Microdochium bolleyi]|uniref:nicotinamidase n=1 Tax=Microdochium bolleyi TaxID=196109 RepID=A0A136JGE5_9PEZI|nr:Isochorismatase-like protein [Microdochium bolleyi]
MATSDPTSATSPPPPPPFRPALLVIDFQQDFCPPHGSLAVPGGRDITPVVNALLASPSFALRIATRDWHPADHVSFASNHHTVSSDGSSKEQKRPFVDTVAIANPLNPEEVIESRLWPVHCVQNTPGAELVPELDAARLDRVVDKGMDKRVEMYSPFFDPFRTSPAAPATDATVANSTTTSQQGARGAVCDSGLAALLASHAVTDVYVVGLAADYCVQSAAADAAGLGYATYVVEDGTRPVDAAAWADTGRRELEAKGVRLVRMRDAEITRLDGLGEW